MAKWIQAAKTIYSIDSDTEVTIKGDVNNLNWFTQYKYTVYIGSGGTEFKVAENKTAADFSGDGFSFPIKKSGDGNFAKIATKSGQSCYIRAVGVANDKKVEYTTYITLKAAYLVPEISTLNVSAINSKVTAFGTNCAVVGFSALKVDVTCKELKYDSWIKSVSFSLPFFQDINYSAGNTNSKNVKQSATSGILDRNGEFTLFCTVTNNFGYSSTKEVSFHISNYGAPTLKFEGGPHRTVDENGTPLDRKDADKTRKYGFSMALKVEPYIVKNLKGAETVFNKIVAYNSTNNQKAFITLTDLSNKAVAYLSSANVTNASIGNDGVLTTSYKSGSSSPTVGYPVFNNDETGLFTYRAYQLKILVKDSTGTVYTLTANVPSMTTTLHLRKGGRGVSIGGYSEGDDDLFESYWKFKAHDMIEAEADSSVVNPGGAGTVKGKFVEASSQFKLNGTTVKGIGTGEDKLAKGNHTHGIIKNNGTVDTENAVMISNDKKALQMIDKIPFANLTINSIATNVKADGTFEKSDTSCKTLIELLPSFKENPIKNVDITVKSGSPGNEESGLCYADHQHPYSREWANDPLIVKMIQSIMIALTGYL